MKLSAIVAVLLLSMTAYTAIPVFIDETESPAEDDVPQWDSSTPKQLKAGKSVGVDSGNLVERSGNNEISADTLSEITGDNGVAVDSLTIKDGGVTDMQLFVANAATELTISGGAITPTQLIHTVDGEGDSADDLATVSGGTAEQLLILRPESAARDITIKHGTGNIVTPDGADYVVPDNGYVIMCFDGANWRLLSAGASAGTYAVSDGDILDIDWNPSNYTPDTAPAEASDIDDLSAHLYGIDQAIGSLGTGTVDTSGTPVTDDIAVFTDADTLQGQTISELDLTENSNATQTFVLAFTIPDDDGYISGAQPVDGSDLAMFTSGTYSSQSSLTYKVEIDANGTPDTFKWSDDGGSTWDATEVAITGAAQTLNNGVQIKFTDTTAHTIGDAWMFYTTGAETDDLHFQIQLDDNADYSSTIIDHDSRDAGDGGDGQTGCEYYDGSAFVAWPASGGTGNGVAEAYHGNSGSYSFTSASVSRGTKYYWQIRFHDGTSWGAWTGRTVSW